MWFCPNLGDTICLGRCDEVELLQLDPKHELIQRAPLTCNNIGQNGARVVFLVTQLCHVVRQCACNCERAVVTRHGAKQLEITNAFTVAEMYIAEVQEQFKRFVSELSLLYTFEVWLKKWPLAKRRKILRSMARDRRLPWVVRAFIKRELYHTRPKRPRLIQAYPNLQTQAECALLFTIAQKALSKLWTVDSQFEVRGLRIGITFACGLTSDDLGRWFDLVHHRYQKPFWYERDGASWDARQQHRHFELKYAMCASLEQLVAFMRECSVVKGVAITGKDPWSNVVRYALDGTVKSGHNDTSFGNSMINAFILLEAFVTLGVECSILVMGDDCLVATAHDFDCERVVALEASCGIEPEARKFSCGYDVSFASGIWYPTACGHVFGPKVGRLLARLGSTTATLGNNTEQWIKSVVSGLWPVVGGLPIFRAWLKPAMAFDDATPEQKKAWFDHDYDMFRHSRVAQYQPTIRGWFCDRYGITEADLEWVEGLLADVGLQPILCRHPLLLRLVDHDTCDIQQRPLFVQCF